MYAEEKNEEPLNCINKNNDNENLENINNYNETKYSNEEEDFKEIPQESELIEIIVKEANDNKNNPNFIPKTAKQVNFSLDKNDLRLKMSTNDGSCQFYSFLYVIFRDSTLKRIFEPKVLKDDTDYYILSKIEGEDVTFRIPCSTIAEEKSKNRGNLFPCDEEYVSALGVYLHALLFMKCGFVDRLVFQPFFSTDAFFDQKILNAGFGFSLIFNNEDPIQGCQNENQNENQENQNENQENQNENQENQNENQENQNKNQENQNENQENQKENQENQNENQENQNENQENQNKNQENQNENQENKKESSRYNHNISKQQNEKYLSCLLVHLNQRPEISLTSKENRIDLFSDGSIYIKDIDKLIEGHYIICISIFLKKFKFGHCLFIFFNYDEKKWKIYNSYQDEDYGEYGEMDLKKMQNFFFNGSCIIAGVPKEFN
ncbi:hypothetical protein M9Y10_003442 [Tritrichomonas musculus]|uniref:OTU domain-containing protein n=1 Tax=Tritrichomonas musculus TaxID=1915356 RepID=A0ABR2JPF3_9EUKA